MAQKKGLGRGLAALIPEDDMDFLRRVARGEDSMPVISGAVKGAGALGNGRPEELSLLESSSEGSTSTAETLNPLPASEANPPLFVDIAVISPNRFQPRRQFGEEEMQNLADSIREHGILQPVLLRETDTPGAYELVAGERRWRAAERAGLTRIPALIRVLDDRQSLELAIIENVQRHDISAIDTALAYQKLSHEFHLSQDDIARRVGKSRSAIANTLRLLDLPEEVRKAIEEGRISEGHGRAILTATGEGARRAIFRRVMRDGLSVRDTERLSSTSKNTGQSGIGAASDTAGSDMPHTMAELRDLERHIEKVLGLRVAIRPNGAAGSIVIRYLSSDDLERLRVLLSRTI